MAVVVESCREGGGQVAMVIRLLYVFAHSPPANTMDVRKLLSKVMRCSRGWCYGI